MENPHHQPVDTSKAAPAKSILKKRDSQDTSSVEGERRPQFDEMNIIATFHPANKDYGHMKIDDPPTPYHEYEEEDDDRMETTEDGKPMRERKASFSDKAEIIDEEVLAAKLGAHQPKIQPTSDTEDETLTDSEREHRRSFEIKRKQHYNEFQAVKLARQLLEDEDEAATTSN